MIINLLITLVNLVGMVATIIVLSLLAVGIVASLLLPAKPEPAAIDEEMAS